MKHMLVSSLLLLFCSGSASGITIKESDYHGWSNSIVMSNGTVETVIVPAIGRVMQFGFSGEGGPFWENRQLDGKVGHPNSRQWSNFGGEKTWPAPQSEWPKIIRRGWPPPATFDSLPVLPKIKGDRVELISAVDTFYGIRFHRTVQLDKSKPVMTITTEYRKVEGEPVKVAVWTITQLQDPQLIRVPISGTTEKPYNEQSQTLPRDFKVSQDQITMTRDPETSHKTGFYGDTLIWVGKEMEMRIEVSRERGAEYTDNGSSTEVYTNPEPLPYVELEMLSPIKTLKRGDKLKLTTTYTLNRR